MSTSLPEIEGLAADCPDPCRDDSDDLVAVAASPGVSVASNHVVCLYSLLLCCKSPLAAKNLAANTFSTSRLCRPFIGTWEQEASKCGRQTLQYATDHTRRSVHVSRRTPRQRAACHVCQGGRGDGTNTVQAAEGSSAKPRLWRHGWPSKHYDGGLARIMLLLCHDNLLAQCIPISDEFRPEALPFEQQSCLEF